MKCIVYDAAMIVQCDSLKLLGISNETSKSAHFKRKYSFPVRTDIYISHKHTFKIIFFPIQKYRTVLFTYLQLYESVMLNAREYIELRKNSCQVAITPHRVQSVVLQK